MAESDKNVEILEKINDITDKESVITLPKETLDFFKGDEIRARVFFEKYALRDDNNAIVERTPPQMWQRVAHEIAMAEATPDKRVEWEEKFKWLLGDFRFLPGGRILFGAGQKRRSTLLNCFVTGTRVYTDNGLKPIETINVGDLVLTHNNRYRKVTEVIPQVKQTKLIKLRMFYNNREIVCTPEHKFLTSDGSWVEAKNLDDKTYVRVGLEPPITNIDRVLNLSDYLPAKNLVTTNGFIHSETPFSIKNGYGVVSKMVKRSVLVRNSIEISEELGRFVGFFLSEGGISLPSTLYFTFNLNEENYANEVVALAEKLFGIKGTVRRITHGPGGWLRVEIYSSIICNALLNMFGHYYHDKKLPQKLLNQSDEFIMSVIGSLFAGDGCITKEGVFLQLSNQVLSYQIHKLLLRLGVINSILEVDNGKLARRKAYRVTVSSLYFAEKVIHWMNNSKDSSAFIPRSGSAFKIQNNTLSFKIKKIEELPESDVFVYDLGVEEDHSFVVEDVVVHNCYVIPIKQDSIEAIFDWCKEAARTYSFGGGVGTDISILRPRNAPVNNSALVSTGSVSFMNIFSETTHTIGQHGRRGALMITISVDHPDILSFIKIKRDMQNVRYANISVRITDEFMRAVRDDKMFMLRFDSAKTGRIERQIRARDLWKELVQSARDWAEPGLIFWDTMVKYSPSEYNEMNILSTNPCAEQPLEKFGACDLGNVNLSAFVLDQFTLNARIDWANMEKAVRYGVRFLDNVLTYNDDKHPLKEQAEVGRRSRRIGLGIIGLGDMLVKLRLKYDTEEGLRFVDELFGRIKNAAYDEDVLLATEKGAFPNFEPEKHLSMPFVKTLSPELQEKIRGRGLRNVTVLTVPPTGSVSTLAGTSSGIEPIFAFSYTRRSESLSQEYFKVYHPLAHEYMKLHNIADESELPDFFVPAHKIKAEFRVRMQGTIQKHIDSAISSTVNLPRETTVEQVEKIYFQAWEAGCKGITVYREGSREGILITDEEQKKKDVVATVAETVPWKRETVLTGQTMKMRVPEGSLYITANFDSVSIKEVFINLGKNGSEGYSYCEAIGRLISKYLQSGGDIKEVIESLRGIKSNSSVFWDRGLKIYSIPDAIAKGLEVMCGLTQPSTAASLLKTEPASIEKLTDGKQLFINPDQVYAGSKIRPDPCPSCNERTLVNENGCFTCKSCGYTKCE